MERITIQRECKHHGLTTFVLEPRGYHRCSKCRNRNVENQRRKNKERLVGLFGGKCRVCEYDRCIGGLEFHHVDDENKEFALSDKGRTISFARLKAEASKCVLLCCRCHREVHAGLIECPAIIIPDDPAW